MDEESQRRVILSCSLTLTSGISSLQRSISRTVGEQDRRLEWEGCAVGRLRYYGDGLGRDGTRAGWGDLGLWWLLSKQCLLKIDPSTI